MYIIGDNQGRDTICGRIVHYGVTAKRISRTCDAGPEQYSQPKAWCCNQMIMNDVMRLVKEKKCSCTKQLVSSTTLGSMV